MSAKWRTKNRVLNPTDMPIHSHDYDNIVGTQEAYDTTPQLAAYYLGGSQDLSDADMAYPVQNETINTDADGYTPNSPLMQGEGNATFNMINREIGGVRGQIGDVPYSLGVTASDSVENFRLEGQQAIIRRGRNPADTGPVGTNDYNGRLALQYAMTVNQFFPNEASQANLVRHM